MLTAELNRTRTIGAEYEMVIARVGSGDGMDVQRTLAEVLSANGVRAIARPYSHAPVPNNADVAVEFDNSVRGESRYQGIHWFPVEIKTRILNGIDDWETVVPPMLDICRYMGARVNASAGHHLHLGFGEIKDDVRHVRSLWNLFHRYNDVIFGLVAPSRRHSTFCRPMPSSTKILHGANSIRTLRRRLANYDRYSSLNLTHLFDGDAARIELRHRDSTLEADKARHWLRFCMRLVDHAVTRSCQAAAVPVENNRKGLERLLIGVGLKVNSKVYSTVSPELRQTGKHMLRRWKQFNGNISLRKFDADLKAGISR